MNNRGFTLIELLVVIAIIGILSSIVLVSVDSARNKGANAAVYATFHQIANQAALYAATNPNFGISVSSCSGGVFSDTVIQSAEENILINSASGATFTCYTNSAGTKWAISISALKTGGSWCEDNSSAFRATTAQNTGLCS